MAVTIAKHDADRLLDAALADTQAMNPLDLKRRLILVTGAPRSGTTAVGQYLGWAERTATLYEPMNYDTGDKCIQRYFEVPGSDEFSFQDFDDLVSRVSRLRLNLKSGIFSGESLRRVLLKTFVGSQSRQSYARARIDPRCQTIIWKDPIAVFAARRLTEQFRVPVVVTPRPPVAVVASFKRLNWQFDVKNISERCQADSALPFLPDNNLVEKAASL